MKVTPRFFTLCSELRFATSPENRTTSEMGQMPNIPGSLYSLSDDLSMGALTDNFGGISAKPRKFL